MSAAIRFNTPTMTSSAVPTTNAPRVSTASAILLLGTMAAVEVDEVMSHPLRVGGGSRPRSAGDAGRGERRKTSQGNRVVLSRGAARDPDAACHRAVDEHR